MLKIDEPGQQFAPHYDGAFSREDETSLLTFIVYLNDVKEGGHTTFFINQKPIKVSPVRNPKFHPIFIDFLMF